MGTSTAYPTPRSGGLLPASLGPEAAADIAMTTPTREENRIRIVREIPLWGVITGLIAFLMMAGAAAYNQFAGQQRLLELMTAQGAANSA